MTSIRPPTSAVTIASTAQADKDRKRLGHNVQVLLRALRKRPAWLAEQTGLSVQKIYAIQSGREAPSFHGYLAICRALGVREPPLI